MRSPSVRAGFLAPRGGRSGPGKMWGGREADGRWGVRECRFFDAAWQHWSGNRLRRGPPFLVGRGVTAGPGDIFGHLRTLKPGQQATTPGDRFLGRPSEQAVLALRISPAPTAARPNRGPWRGLEVWSRPLRPGPTIVDAGSARPGKAGYSWEKTSPVAPSAGFHLGHISRAGEGRAGYIPTQAAEGLG